MAKRKAPKEAPSKAGESKDLTAEIKALLKQYKKEEQSEDGHGGRGLETWQNSNCLWLIGDGKIAKALKKHLMTKKMSAFWAKHFGVTEERFKQWRDLSKPNKSLYRSEVFRCTQILKSGEQCKTRADIADVPKLFVAGLTDRCHRHSEYQNREVTRESQIEIRMITLSMSRAEAKAEVEALEDISTKERLATMSGG